MTSIIPDDALRGVFSYLPGEDLATCAVVCRRWNRVALSMPGRFLPKDRAELKKIQDFVNQLLFRLTHEFQARPPRETFRADLRGLQTLAKGIQRLMNREPLPFCASPRVHLLPIRDELIDALDRQSKSTLEDVFEDIASDNPISIPDFYRRIPAMMRCRESAHFVASNHYRVHIYVPCGLRDDEQFLRRLVRQGYQIDLGYLSPRLKSDTQFLSEIFSCLMQNEHLRIYLLDKGFCIDMLRKGHANNPKKSKFFDGFYSNFASAIPKAHWLDIDFCLNVLRVAPPYSKDEENEDNEVNIPELAHKRILRRIPEEHLRNPAILELCRTNKIRIPLDRLSKKMRDIPEVVLTAISVDRTLADLASARLKTDNEFLCSAYAVLQEEDTTLIDVADEDKLKDKKLALMIASRFGKFSSKEFERDLDVVNAVCEFLRKRCSNND